MRKHENKDEENKASSQKEPSEAGEGSEREHKFWRSERRHGEGEGKISQVANSSKTRRAVAGQMSRDFNAPPVVFPSGGGATAANPRRPPSSAMAPQFQPPRPAHSASGASNPALPFMSFDMSAAAASTSTAPPPSLFTSSTIPTSSFEDEPPLLEELGINTRQIWRKTVSILNPIRVNSNLHEDGDLSGPFIFLMAFGLFQLLAGKFHFGIILGWVTVAAMFLYFVFNMLLGRNGNLDLYRCFSLVGYCMLPMVMFSAISLFVPRGGVVMFGLGLVFVLWSTRVCTRLLAEIASCGDEHRGLVAYACWLVFCLFSLLVIF